MMDPIVIFQQACETGKLYTLEKLIEAKLFDVNCVVEDKSKAVFSALLYAVKYGTSQLIKLLLEEGARVNDHSENVLGGKTPLILATKLQDLNKIKVLLHYGADITYQDSKNKSALHYALHSIASAESKICEAILSHGCELSGNSRFIVIHRTFCKLFRALLKKNVGEFEKLLKTISDLELHEVENVFTPLWYASKKLILEVIDIYSRRDSRYVVFNNLKIKDLHIRLSIFEYLFTKCGLDANIQDERGRTVLHLLEKSCESFSFFLKNGSDPMIASEDRKRPRHTCNGCYKKCFVAKYYSTLYLLDEEFFNNETQIIFHGDNNLWLIEIFQEEFQEYKEELEVLKTNRISQSTSTSMAISLYDYLFLQPTEVVRYSGNENLNRMYEENERDFSKKFPHYGFVINYQFQRGLRRKVLLEDAAKVLFTAFGSTISIEIPEEILQYLSDNELKKMSHWT